MITQNTAGRIWNLYREIAAGEHLLTELEELARKHQGDVRCATLKDAFGRQRNLSLGVPSSDSSSRMYDVHPELAKSVIRAHIANCRAQLVEACEQARIELNKQQA